MKHLKKFNESKNDSEIYDKEDLLLLVGYL